MNKIANISACNISKGGFTEIASSHKFSMSLFEKGYVYKNRIRTQNGTEFYVSISHLYLIYKFNIIVGIGATK